MNELMKDHELNLEHFVNGKLCEKCKECDLYTLNDAWEDRFSVSCDYCGNVIEYKVSVRRMKGRKF